MFQMIVVVLVLSWHNLIIWGWGLGGGMEDWNIGGLQQRIMVYNHVGEAITTNLPAKRQIHHAYYFMLQVTMHFWSDQKLNQIKWYIHNCNMKEQPYHNGQQTGKNGKYTCAGTLLTSRVLGSIISKHLLYRPQNVPWNINVCRKSNICLFATLLFKFVTWPYCYIIALE